MKINGSSTTIYFSYNGRFLNSIGCTGFIGCTELGFDSHIAVSFLVRAVFFDLFTVFDQDFTAV